MTNNGGDMAREIGLARAALAGKLGVPILNDGPTPRALVQITLLDDGSVNFQASGDEIVTRFLLAKGASIYEQMIQGAMTRQQEGT